MVGFAVADQAAFGRDLHHHGVALDRTADAERHTLTGRDRVRRGVGLHVLDAQILVRRARPVRHRSSRALIFAVMTLRAGACQPCLPFRRSIATSAPNSPTFSQKRAGRMARQFIYHMQGLSKTYPPNRKVLDNIHLSFYPDAKIGV